MGFPRSPTYGTQVGLARGHSALLVYRVCILTGREFQQASFKVSEKISDFSQFIARLNGTPVLAQSHTNYNLV